MTTRLAPEIIWFTPSDDYLDDPAAVLAKIHKSSERKGPLASYYGVELGQPGTCVWIMAWRSLASHQSFMQEESYVDFILPIMDAMAGTGKITQLRINHGQWDLYKVLASPITQFIYITVRQFHDRDYELEPLIAQLHEGGENTDGCISSCWGSSVDNEHLEVGIVGWRSIEDRNRAIHPSSRLYSIIQRIREFTKVELRFAKLTCHSTNRSSYY